MEDTRSVVLTLPSEMAHRVEEVQQRNPEALERVLRYGLLRQSVFEILAHAPPARAKLLT